MNPNEHFFQAFFGPQTAQIESPKPGYIIHNEMVFEIANNWNAVVSLIKKHKNGTLKQVDQYEHDWYNFIVNNGVDIMSYKNEEEFLTAQVRIP